MDAMDAARHELSHGMWAPRYIYTEEENTAVDRNRADITTCRQTLKWNI